MIDWSNIKLLALDVDGILTDGGLYYTENGEELKKFNVKDGLGLKLIMERGIEVAIITQSHAKVTQYRSLKLGINHVFIGVEHKLQILQKLIQGLQIPLSQVAYMGDDLNDLPVLQAVGHPITVKDAVIAVKKIATYITEKPGGHGAVREICDLLLENNKSC